MTEVVRLGPDDWQEWREIRLRGLLDTPLAFGSTHDREVEYDEPRWREWMTTPLFVIREDGRAVAMGGVHERDDTAHLFSMWVDPAYRGRGYSRLILDTLVTWGRERGLPVELCVTIGNTAAEAAYARYGFVDTGRRQPLREGLPQQLAFLRLPS